MPKLSILGPNGKPYRSETVRADIRDLRAKYDAAQSDAKNANHWSMADGLSAREANSPEVRRVLRNRARYEIANNCYASSMAETLGIDTIGTGPRLQVRSEDDATNRRVSEAFEEWTAATCLAEKLRTFRESRFADGESFALFTTNDNLPTPVKLDLTLIEADQVATPDLSPMDRYAVDGIELDRNGNPIAYHVLPYHPGDMGAWSATYGKYDRVPADLVLHWFKRRRPGQYRGIPEITPALPLFSMLRRYSLAVLSAAEVAAMFAALIKTAMPPNDGTSLVTPFDTEEIVRGMMTFLPEGYDVTQLKAEQPTTTFPDYKKENLNEVGRCAAMPLNVVTGNSSGYNFSSGRLDHLPYRRAIGVDRYYCETAILDRILGAWLKEAAMVDRALVRSLDLSSRGLPKHEWAWDGFEHIDPQNEATAQQTRLQNGTTTMADIWAAEGHDWRDKARQVAEERRYYTELGIPYPGDMARPATGAPASDDSRSSEESGNEDRSESNGRAAAVAIRRFAR